MSRETFTTQGDMTDISFVVEDKRLYFNKTVLAICSPVFKKMFNSGFKEKDADEIPLPGKTYEDFAAFLEQIHPCCTVPVTDDILEPLLSLSDEYQVDHLRSKCQQYISTQIDRQGKLPTDQTLFYLLLFEMYKLEDYSSKSLLMYMAAGEQIADLEESPNFSRLPDGIKGELVRKRCLLLEKEREDKFYAKSTKKAKILMLRKSELSDVPALCLEMLSSECWPSCYPCQHGNFRCSPDSRGFGSRCVNRQCVRFLKKKSFCKTCIENMFARYCNEPK